MEKRERCDIRGRRHILKSAVGLMALGVPDVFAQGGRGRGAAPPEPVKGTQLVLLGTQGGPNINLRRTQASSAVIVDGRAYLVDCGYGTLRALVTAGITYQQLSTIFITHLHNDHTSDLAALLTHQWTGSRTEPTDVYGPHGTAAMVTGAVAFFKGDVDIRTVDEGRTSRPESLFRGHDLAATAAPAQAFKDDRVTVRSVENAHFPDRARQQMPYRALSYRFDTPSRSIVITGDTAYSRNLVDLSKGADLFVCEVLDQSTYETMMARAKTDAESGNANSVSRHVAETHSTPSDVGRMAAEAGVKTVVLTHLVGGQNTGRGAAEPSDTPYIEGVRKQFSGEVIVGRDQMVL